MITVVSIVVLLGILIFSHELGHFLTAKFSGVGVLKFSLGFGPRVIGKKIGETEYVISLIPLGGYVKLLGESEEEIDGTEDLERSFLKQSPWKKILIVVAGPVFNFLLAALLFTVVYLWGVPVLLPEIGNVQKDSAAFHAGLLSGDTVTSIDHKEISRWTDMATIINDSDGRVILLSIKRDKEIKDISIKPQAIEAKNIFGEEVNSFKIGISPSGATTIERLGILQALAESGRQTWTITKLTFLSVIKMLEGVISPKTLGGPIMIAQLAGRQAEEGAIPFLLFMALLSINLAVLNLLPIPILDGGHLFFYLIEALTGKEINIKWREKAQQVGFVILVLLMIFVLFMDLGRLNIKFFQNIANAIF